MKTLNLIFTIAFMLTINSYLFSQCSADAGVDIHRCSVDSSVQLGGNPTAFGGTPPYTYEWSINPIQIPSQTIPYIYASHILDDTTAANPNLIYLGASLIGESLVFYLKITDDLGCQSFDTLQLTTSIFNIHLMYYDYWINEGDSIYLNNGVNLSGGFGASTYDWNPSYGLSDTNIASGFWASPSVSTAYTVTVTDSKGCSRTASGPLYYIHVITAGIDKNKKNLIELFPNPTTGKLFITNKENKKVKKIELYTSLGKKIEGKFEYNNGIDLSKYPTGIYILKITDSQNSVSIRKIILNK